MREFFGIGVNEYDRDCYNNLSGAIEDASKMGAFFQYGLPEGYRFDRVKLMDNPTESEVSQYLEDAIDRLSADSFFVFYFSGHGLFHRNTGQQFLLCRDASRKLLDGYAGSGALSLDAMRWFSQHGKGNMFFCYDVCRRDILAGPDFGGASGFKDATSEPPDKRAGGSGSRWSLLSCGDGELAQDNGCFVDAFLAEMKDVLKYGRELKLCDELVDGTIERLRRAGVNQTPESGHSGTTIILAPGLKKGAGGNGRDEELERLRRRLEELEKQTKSEEKPTPPPAPKPFVDGVGQSFVRIEPGSFMMGNVLSPDEIAKRWGGEKRLYEDAPRHRVELTRPYYMSKYQVTRDEFAEFVQATGYETTAEQEGSAWGYDEDGDWSNVKGLNWRNPGFSQDDDHPVVCMSWHDAQKYIDWLNETHKRDLPSGFRYALPTEAQWEYACRAGTETEFFWGTNEAKDSEGYLNAADETGSPNGNKWSCFFPFKSGYTATSPVGAFNPNNWGLYDMLGNAWEWCADWYGDYPRKPAVDPTGPSSGSDRVLRGGSWYSDPGDCRSACRNYYDPADRDGDSGFRLAMTGESALS